MLDQIVLMSIVSNPKISDATKIVVLPDGRYSLDFELDKVPVLITQMNRNKDNTNFFIKVKDESPKFLNAIHLIKYMDDITNRTSPRSNILFEADLFTTLIDHPQASAVSIIEMKPDYYMVYFMFNKITFKYKQTDSHMLDLYKNGDFNSTVTPADLLYYVNSLA